MKILAELLDPVAVLWLMLIACSYSFFRKKEQRRAGLSFLLALGLWCFGATPLTSQLVASLEREAVVAAMAPRKADAVLTLGGTHVPSQHDSFLFSLGDAADRLVTAIELVRSGLAPTLVLGGAGPVSVGSSQASHTLVITWIEKWSLVDTPVLHLGICKNTRQEALQTRSLMDERKWSSIVLVTSALHMKRARGTFEKVGIKVVPVPSDFRAEGVFQAEGFHLFPRVGHLWLLTDYLHERVGWVYYRLRGWL
jgi:uncharacterized SAM-binding protein YcdF (DUF218 family)